MNDASQFEPQGSEGTTFEPKILAYVCNWCTYLGADLAGTTRLEYPPNIRIVRLPCTGRIDFNLLIKAFEVGADAVLVSGCHPGDCHYTSGNYHARRRWILFRELLDLLGFDLDRIHFTWISAAEGKKFQQVVTDITEKTRKLGPYTELYAAAPAKEPPQPQPKSRQFQTFAAESELRAEARRLLAEGTVKVVIGYGERGPLLVTRPEDADRLVWNNGCTANLAMYLKRKEVKALGRPAIVVKACDERSLVVLEKESQFERKDLHVIGMACAGMQQPRCGRCTVRTPRFADTTIGQIGDQPAESKPGKLEAVLAMPRAERMAFWVDEFDRCVKCYACRQVCSLCYCERCIVDKNQPISIDPAPGIKGNFAWHIARAFHLAGRCIGCGACAQACPVGIDLGLLNMQLARAAKQHFGYQAGVDPSAELLIGAFSQQDKEEFIG
jgi:coenzyme F420-reducing hydrogenase delta subunit/ferredoxin